MEFPDKPGFGVIAPDFEISELEVVVFTVTPDAVGKVTEKVISVIISPTTGTLFEFVGIIENTHSPD